MKKTKTNTNNRNRNNLRAAAEKRKLRRNNEHYNIQWNCSQRHSCSNKSLNILRPSNISQNLELKLNNNDGIIRTAEEQPRRTKPKYWQALKSKTNTFWKKNSTSHNETNPYKKNKWKIKITQPSRWKSKTRAYLVKKEFKNKFII